MKLLCKDCRQPTDETDMRGSLCRWCLAHELECDEDDRDGDFSQRLEDGFDLLGLSEDDDGDDAEEFLDGFHIERPRSPLDKLLGGKKRD